MFPEQLDNLMCMCLCLSGTILTNNPHLNYSHIFNGSWSDFITRTTLKMHD